MKVFFKKIFNKPLSNLEKLNEIKKKIKKDYVKNFGLEKNSKDKFHYKAFLFYKMESDLFQKCLFLMEELEITYYLEDDTLGASFYELKRYGKVICRTKHTFMFESKNERLYLKLLEMKGNIIK